MASKKKPTLNQHKFYRNRKGILGWIDSRGYNFERYLYTLHRLSGVIMVLYLFAHIYITGSRLGGASLWEVFMGGLHGPLVSIGEFLLIVFVLYHGLNGFRLILSELGFSIGTPKRPRFPYTASSLGRVPKIIFTILMIIAGILLLVAGLEFLFYIG